MSGDSHLLLRAFCDELARCGMRHACTSPGSRNTPIVLALAREPRIRCWSQIDERSAGFFALGAARAAGAPVAVTCTSGTAAANLAPAVIEAHHARIPLLVLTADRPPELREVGAGQAIDQLKIYGDAAKWFFEVGVDVATPATLAWVRQLACRAWWTAASGRPGPVHLNFPLRDPLVPGDLPADGLPGRPGGRPWTTFAPAPPAAAASPVVPLPARGVIVAGRDERDPELGRAVARFARRAGWPLLADPLSGARRGESAIATYDLLLRLPNLADSLEPQLVLRVGDLPTSKPLREWLGSLRHIRQIALDPEGAWHDPAAALWDVLAGDPVATLRAWEPQGPTDPGWLAAWRAADATATATVERVLGDELSEPRVVRLLGEALGPEQTLVVAASMPIRDAELYLGTGDRLPRVVSNRGANGIDGTVSTAFGIVAASGRPVTLLIGDVAIAHDIGGMLAARRLRLNLTIVLVHNDGGGIFHFLPISGERDAFEEHVATPHGLDFAHAAALYGFEHVRAATAPDLLAALASDRPRLIEIRSDRHRNVELHRRVADAVAEAVAALDLTRPAPAASPGA